MMYRCAIIPQSSNQMLQKSSYWPPSNLQSNRPRQQSAVVVSAASQHPQSNQPCQQSSYQLSSNPISSRQEFPNGRTLDDRLDMSSVTIEIGYTLAEGEIAKLKNLHEAIEDPKYCFLFWIENGTEFHLENSSNDNMTIIMMKTTDHVKWKMDESLFSKRELLTNWGEKRTWDKIHLFSYPKFTKTDKSLFKMPCLDDIIIAADIQISRGNPLWDPNDPEDINKGWNNPSDSTLFFSKMLQDKVLIKEQVY